MMTFQTLKRSIEAFTKNRYTNFDILQPFGNPRANVMVVGMGADKDEKEPFSGPTNGVLRATLKKLNVSPEMVLLTYLVKASVKGRMPMTHLDGWTGLLFKEFEAISPKAVILLGDRLVSAAFGLRDGVEDMRYTRYTMRARPDMSFFVTYSLDDVAKAGPGSQIYNDFIMDLIAVFRVDAKYFARLALLGGSDAKGK